MTNEGGKRMIDTSFLFSLLNVMLLGMCIKY